MKSSVTLTDLMRSSIRNSVVCPLIDTDILNISFMSLVDTYLTLPFSIDDFDITTALHPNTYLNKILIASRQGTMQLWNIKTRYAI